MVADMHNRLIIILTLLALAACSARPVMQTPSSISIEHDALLRTAAFQKAADHCQRYGKSAVHLTTNGYPWAVSSFRCE